MSFLKLDSAKMWLDEGFLKESWGRLSSSSWEDLFKTSSRHFGQHQYIFVFVIRLQDIFKKFSRRLQDVFQKRLQDIFKTPCKIRLQDILKTTSRHFQDLLQRCLQDLFKSYHQVKLFLIARLRDVINTFLRCTAKTVIYRRICLGHTSEKFMVSVQNLQE